MECTVGAGDTASRRVEVVPYRPAWRSDFQVEAGRIACVLGNVVKAVHHIGSTAIPGIWAKPIIDLLVEVDNIAGLEERAPSMEGLGYEVLGESGLPGRRYFRKANAAGIRTHHVHGYRAGEWEVLRHLAFRDYMLTHPAAAQAYSDLKQRLARQHPYDIEAYMNGKDSFVKEHEARAIAWRLSQAPT